MTQINSNNNLDLSLKNNPGETPEDSSNQSEDEVLDQQFPYITLRKIISLPRKFKHNKKVIIDISDTKYEVIKNTCNLILQWQVLYTASNSRDEWNIKWIDSYISEDDLRKMLPYQRINHFPGSQ